MEYDQIIYGHADRCKNLEFILWFCQQNERNKMKRRNDFLWSSAQKAAEQPLHIKPKWKWHSSLFIPHWYCKQEAKIEQAPSLSALPFPSQKMHASRVIWISTDAENLEEQAATLLNVPESKRKGGRRDIMKMETCLISSPPRFPVNELNYIRIWLNYILKVVSAASPGERFYIWFLVNQLLKSSP